MAQCKPFDCVLAKLLSFGWSHYGPFSMITSLTISLDKNRLTYGSGTVFFEPRTGSNFPANSSPMVSVQQVKN